MIHLIILIILAASAGFLTKIEGVSDDFLKIYALIYCIYAYVVVLVGI